MSVPYDKLGRDAIDEKGWLIAYKWLILRRFSQISILALFMIGPVAGVWILKGNLASSEFLETIPMTDPLLFLQMMVAGNWVVPSAAITGVLLIVAFYLIVGGRVYCAWVCPVNIVTDSAHWLRRRLSIKASMRFNQNTKYWMLGMVLLLSLITGSLAYELINPVSMLHRGLIFGMTFGWMVIFGIFLFDLVVMKHGWCGHICPMGAFYGLLGAQSFVRVRADQRGKCDDCMECYEVCPEPQVIPPALKGNRGEGAPATSVIMAGACINCGRCIDICPHNVFNFGFRFPALPASEREPQGKGMVQHGT